MKNATDPITANLHVFVAFARKRLGDQAVAEDVVQESLLKAIRSGGMPVDEKEMVIWFYRVLRRTIIDVYRRQQTHARTMESLLAELPAEPGKADRRSICQCFKRLLPELPDQYRELLTRVDLDGASAMELSVETGMSVNAINVKLHRARRSLRDKLVATCKVCSKHGCIDCTCC